MFERFTYPECTVFFTIAAFAVAASIFLAFGWRALRMTPRQVERLERLPFGTETPSAGHGKNDTRTRA